MLCKNLSPGLNVSEKKKTENRKYKFCIALCTLAVNLLWVYMSTNGVV